MKSNNIEFRWSDCNKKFELIQWEGKTCFVIAFFDEDKEGWDMRTVGHRFFNAPQKDAWLVGSCAMHFLNELFKSRMEPVI